MYQKLQSFSCLPLVSIPQPTVFLACFYVDWSAEGFSHVLSVDWSADVNKGCCCVACIIKYILHNLGIDGMKLLQLGNPFYI